MPIATLDTTTAAEALERARRLVDAAEEAQRRALAALVELWPTQAWRAAGLPTPWTWLRAYTRVAPADARRLVRLAELCTRQPAVAAAVADGTLGLGRAEVLARAATTERLPFLGRSLPALVDLARGTADDDAFGAGVRFWADQVDQQLAPRHELAHRLYLSPSLFGSGEIHGHLTPSCFATVAAALDAFMQDADPADAPCRRTVAERRADALDDLAHFALTHEPHQPGPGCGDVCTDDPAEDVADLASHDTFDGTVPRDDLEIARDRAARGASVDVLDVTRERLRDQERHRRRRRRRAVQPRAGVRATVVIDLHTLAGRSMDDLDDAVLRTDGWTLAERAARRLLCDASFEAALFAGRHRLLDANVASDRFSARQRRAIAARDHHCVFPGCGRTPRHCDVHHVVPLADGGPSAVDNGVLVCRFHHRLVHEHGWTLARGPDGAWQATDRHGTTWTGRPPPD